MLKINLHCHDKPRDGYENFDINFSSSEVAKVSSYLLEKIDRESVGEIIVNAGCLESIERSQIPNAVSQWKKKLSPNGILKLNFLDTRKMCDSVVYDRLNLIEFENTLLNRKSLHGMFELRMLLKDVGFNVQYCDYSANDMLGTIHAT